MAKIDTVPYDFTRKKDIIKALGARGREQERLFKLARQLRDSHFQERVEVRSVIEYSNICQQTCNFCGMNARSGIKRYVLADEAVLKRVKRLYKDGRRVIMFQTGECRLDPYFKKLYSLLKKIKELYPDLTIIGCFGNLSEKKYKKLRDIGIERYLLKFETSDPALYRKIKPSDTFANRLSNIKKLKKMGFQVSSGNIIGLPGQTIESIADDLLLLKKLGIPMGSTSAFIPNQLSAYSKEKPGDLDLALNFTAILRIMCPEMLIPTTSSLESLVKKGQYMGLLAGANTVTLHDGTPRNEENRFVIYKLGRYIPKNSLFGVVKKAGLKCSHVSLIRDSYDNSLFHKLIIKNLNRKTPAVHSDEGKYTYRDIYDMTSRFVSYIRKKNIAPGDTVVLALYDSIELVVSFLTCIRMGITVGLADPLLSKAEWRPLLKDLDPEYVFTTEDVCKKMRDGRFLGISDNGSPGKFLSFLKKYPKSADIITPDHNNAAIVLFTSGTTGRAKGVIHTYKNLFVDAFPRTILEMKKKDLTFSCSRMHTSFGLGNSLLFPFHFGAGTILSRNIPNPYSIRKILKLKPTLFFAVPSMYSVLLPHAVPLGKLFKSVRLFISSGEKLQAELCKKWKTSYGSPLLDSFGSTEMCHPFISNIPGKERPGTCGKIVKGFQVKFSRTGNILYRGPSLFTGYCGDEKLTRKRLKNGWFRSDDMGYLDEKGYMFFKGRDNFVVKSGGRWISFLDIENKLSRCATIDEAVVTEKDNGLHYHVALKDKKNYRDAERKIRRFCAKKMRIHELPAEIHILERIPKTRSGKINRTALNR